MNVLARTAKFVKGMGRARRGLRDMKKDVRGVNKDVLGFGSSLRGLAAALTIGGVTRFVSSTVQEIDALAKAAEKLGLATDELQFFRFAAERSGTDVRKLETAIQRMVRRIGEASEGEGAALKAFERMGIDVDELIRMKPADQFRLILRELGKIPNVNERINRTNKFFDSEGVDLVRLATANMRELERDFARFATRIGDVDADKMEQIADSFTNLSEVVKGLGRGFLIDVSDDVLPAIQAVLSLQAEMDARRGVRPSEKLQRARRKARSTAIAPGLTLGARAVSAVDEAVFGGGRAAREQSDLELQMRIRKAADRAILGTMRKLDKNLERQNPGTFN